MTMQRDSWLSWKDKLILAILGGGLAFGAGHLTHDRLTGERYIIQEQKGHYYLMDKETKQTQPVYEGLRVGSASYRITTGLADLVEGNPLKSSVKRWMRDGTIHKD